jgi:2-polyprenyl-6-methoxyphenol hydroxylase-like FAD-dependent oxidoreductase
VSGDHERYHGASDESATSDNGGDELTPRPAPPGTTVYESPRETPVHAQTDVLVIGGGPAGCAAALAARRHGAEVVLVERYNHLGGLSTGGLVIWIDRMTDWTGRLVIDGFAREILEQLPDHAVAGAPEDQWGSQDDAAVAHWGGRQGAFRGVVTWSPMIDPEWLKLASVELLAAAGVRFLFHSWAADVVRDGSDVSGVIFESKQGRRALLARVVIDATGDLDVCRRAGASFESDAEGSESNIQHCLNTGWTWAGVDFKRWLAFKREDPQGHRALMEQAREALGYVERPVIGWRDDVALFLGPRLRGYSGLDVADLTRVEIHSRRRMLAHLDYFRRHAPGFEHAWFMLSAPQVGVRHTGRVVGRHPMCAEEWKRGVRHPDEIGVSPSPSQAFENVSVPYGALLPTGLDNVLVAGRHIACDSQTQAFMREIPQCWLTGQAAGAAAALASDAGVAPSAVDVGELQDALRAQGAYLQPAGAVRPAAATAG